MERRWREWKKADAAVVGAGPAGRYMAALLARRGLEVILLDPALEKGWKNTYGAWADELEGLEIEIPLVRKWPRPVVYAGEKPGKEPRRLTRAYGLIDKRRLLENLEAIFEKEGVVQEAVKVLDVKDERRRMVLECEGGLRVDAQVVIDAGGGRSGLTKLEERRPGFQSAYGIAGRFSGDPLEGEEMVLMDFRPPFGGELREGEPTFLYGMKLGEGRYFVEETVLVGREPRSFEELQARLEERLRRRGVEILEVQEEERCLIPMGAGLPRLDQRIIAFGAAAGFVHPATGYQISRMFRAAAAAANRIEGGLKHNLAPEVLSRQVWALIWPEEVRRARELLLFGQEVLLGMEGGEMGKFFEFFFELPDEDWRLYLSGDGEFRPLAAVMLRLFGSASFSLRWALARRAFGKRGIHLVRAFLGDGKVPEENESRLEGSFSTAEKEGRDVRIGG